MSDPTDFSSLGDVLKDLVRKDGFGSKKALEGRALAQQVLHTHLGPLAPRASIASLRVGVVVIETDSSAMFQELEGFQKKQIFDALRAAGLNVSEVRVRLARP